MNCYLIFKLRKFGDKSRNSLATKKNFSFSRSRRRVRPAKLINHSARANLEIEIVFIVTQLKNKSKTK